MTKKTVLMIAAIVAFVAVIVVGVTFAWFVYFRNTMIVITGDANISVEGWCGSASRMEERDELFADPNSKMEPGKSNIFGEIDPLDYEKEVKQIPLAASQFITYKFQITNNSDRPATLSLRINNMFDYIFNELESYIGSGGNDAQLDFSEIANENNGRLAFLFDYIYYEKEQTDSSGNIIATATNGKVTTKRPDGTVITKLPDGRTIVRAADGTATATDPDGTPIDPDTVTIPAPAYINDPGEDMYIWKYSRDERIIGNHDDDRYDGDLHQKINKIYLPPAVKGVAPYKINLYLSLTNKQGTVTTDEYKKWFAGEEAEGVITPGVAHEYAVNRMYGKTWEKLYADNPTVAQYIHNYVTRFVKDEIDSIMLEDEVLLNLNLKYFEFIGENASEDDVNALPKQPWM